MEILKLAVLLVSIWGTCQLIKYLLNRFRGKNRKDFSFISTGGMPSSHSAVVCTCSTGIGMMNGFNSPVFILSLLIAVIIMHDAVQVRRAVGNTMRTIKVFFSDAIEREFKKKMNLYSRMEQDFRNSHCKNSGKKLRKLGLLKAELSELKHMPVVYGHKIKEVSVGAFLGVVITIIVFL